MDSVARAALVNRTHRVVRARAQSMSERRKRLKSLSIPLMTCAALLVILSTAVWTALDQYELNPTGIPDASDQMLVFVLWFFPVSAALMAMIWFRRSRNQSSSEAIR
jgi:Fe2+ transport system protein B